jgi:predicted MPP superfamily phosphohydrolase
MPFKSIVLVAALLHLYVGWRVAPALPGGWAIGLWVLLFASAVFAPLGMTARRFAPPRVADTLAWIGLLFMGLFSSLFVLAFLRDLVLLLAQAAQWLRPGLAPLVSRFSHASALAVPLLGGFVTALGFVNARRTARVVVVDVPIAGLAPALQGFTIAQISDIHVGPTIKRRYLQGIVDAVNALDADMVAITGDLVDGSVPELARHVAPLSGLVSRHGSYFVTGNHEYYAGAHAWIDELRRLGVRVLLNEHVVLHVGGAPLVVAGVTDYAAHHFDRAHRSDPQAALLGAPPAATKLLLAHQPRSSAAAAEAGFDLQLSGHTHGGQFLPWTFFVRLQQPFTAGLHRLGSLWVYVSRGTGYWGPPKRFGAPSEITHLRLMVAPN